MEQKEKEFIDNLVGILMGLYVQKKHNLSIGKSKKERFSLIKSELQKQTIENKDSILKSILEMEEISDNEKFKDSVYDFAFWFQIQDFQLDNLEKTLEKELKK